MAGSNEEGTAAGGDVVINALTRDACRMEVIQSEYSSVIVAVLGFNGDFLHGGPPMRRVRRASMGDALFPIRIKTCIR